MQSMSGCGVVFAASYWRVPQWYRKSLPHPSLAESCCRPIFGGTLPLLGPILQEWEHAAESIEAGCRLV